MTIFAFEEHFPKLFHSAGKINVNQLSLNEEQARKITLVFLRRKFHYSTLSFPDSIGT
jgi:hypothetical protein